MLLYSTPVITAYIICLTVIIGLVLGSFINCAAWRATHGESVVHGHSHCTTCGHDLGLRDLIPVFSWLSTKGRCRYCGEKVSARYPVTELLCAVVFVSIVLSYDLSLITLEMLVLACILLAASLVDIDDYRIPNALIIAGIVVRAVFILIANIILGFTVTGFLAGIGRALLGSVYVAIPLFIIVLIADKILKKESMGGGDLKLFFMIGLYFSWQMNILTLILSCIIGIIFAAVTMRKGFAKDKPFPFGPSIALATWVVMLFGGRIIGLYLGLF